MTKVRIYFKYVQIRAQGQQTKNTFTLSKNISEVRNKHSDTKIVYVDIADFQNVFVNNANFINVTFTSRDIISMHLQFR